MLKQFQNIVHKRISWLSSDTQLYKEINVNDSKYIYC